MLAGRSCAGRIDILYPAYQLGRRHNYCVLLYVLILLQHGGLALTGLAQS